MRFTRQDHRVTGERRGTSGAAGYVLVNMVIDDRLRTARLDELDDERGLTAVAFLARAAFPAAGVTIESVSTDNANR